ncbi:ATP-binding protein [Parasalinivibrio latis]|uniref:ATP-binding protein n=1 Tax=Parasalinivibrio latis TaxID=2952610 RepID=UPI0030E354EF
MSFRLKTILGVAIIELVVLAILILSGLNWLQDSNNTRLAEGSQRLAKAFANAARDEVISTDLANLQSFVDEAISSNDIDYLRFVDNTNMTLAEGGDRNSAGQTINYDEEPSESSDGVYDTYAHVVLDGINFGRVELGINVSRLGTLMEEARRYSYSVAAVEVVLVALFSLLLGNYLTNRLYQLQNAASQIKKHGPGTTVDISGSDELAEVSSEFNRMSTSLAESYQSIIEEKQRYLSLSLQHTQLVQLVEQTQEAFLIADCNDRILWANQALATLTGYALSAVKDNTPGSVLLSPDTSSENLEALHFNSDAPEARTLTLTCAKRMGQRYEAEINIFPITDSLGNIDRYAYIIRDISESQRIQNELRVSAENALAATHAKSRFLANMSHEIRTPMNTIVGMADLLNETELTQQQRHYINLLSHSSQDLLFLINEILDLSKIEAGKLLLDKKAFNLRELADDCLSMAAVNAGAKGLNVISDIDPAMPYNVKSDPVRLGQIINNLLSNAVKFTDSGSITLKISESQKHPHTRSKKKTRYLISITDTGIGIPADKISIIGNSFEQVDNSNTRRYQGTGLGLAITKNLVNIFGSELKIESEPDKGSRFFFELVLDNVNQVPMDPSFFDGVEVWLECLAAEYPPALVEQLHFWGAAVNPPTPLIPETFSTQVEKAKRVKIVIVDEQSSLPKEQHLPTLCLYSKVTNLPADDNEGAIRHVSMPVKYQELKRALADLAEKSFNGEDIETAKQWSQPPDLKGKTLLIVDDIQSNRILAKALLVKTGARLFFANNGNEAFELYRKHRPEMILSDVSMPIMDGYEMTQLIRDHESCMRLQACIIVGLSAHAAVDDYELAHDAGMNAYLTKPLRKEELYRMLHHFETPMAEFSREPSNKDVHDSFVK